MLLELLTVATAARGVLSPSPEKTFWGDGVAHAVSLFTQLPVTIDPETSDRASAETLALARQHALSVYDAAYLELSLRRGASLASLDGPLRLVAKQLAVPVLPKKLAQES